MKILFGHHFGDRHFVVLGFLWGHEDFTFRFEITFMNFSIIFIKPELQIG